MLEVKNLSFSYDRNSAKVLDDVSFELSEGELCAVLGINGIGKSTLLKCIDRILRPQQGKVLVDGQNVALMPRREAAKFMAFIPQSVGAVSMTVYDMVLLGRKPYINWDASEADHRLVHAAIEKMDLKDKSLCLMSELSGGEAQKVLLARALVQQPRLLLLDEPTSKLDPKNQHQAMQLICSVVKERNLGALVVMHDLNLALRYCDSYIFLKDGRVLARGRMEELDPALLMEVYGMRVKFIDCDGITVAVSL